jgi:hypothetical protein
MRVIDGVAFCVVLAMNCDPGFRGDAKIGQPNPHAE